MKLNSRSLRPSWPWLPLCLLTTTISVGCTSQTSDETTDASMEAGQMVTNVDDPNIGSPSDSSVKSSTTSDSNRLTNQSVQRTRPDDNVTTPSPDLSQRDIDSTSSEDPLTIMQTADQNMKDIIDGQSGITDPAQTRRTLLAVIDRKRRAADELIDDPNSSRQQQIAGYRGLLQSYSHLASLQDARAAGQLRRLADELARSDLEELHTDAAMVQTGFAVEQVRLESDGASETLIQHCRRLAKLIQPDNVPALLMLGQAMEVARQAGEDETSNQIAGLIQKRFAAAKNPEIIKMVSRLTLRSGSDELEGAFNELLQEGPSERKLDQLLTQIELALNESANRATVVQIARMASQLEVLDLVNASGRIYDTLDAAADSLSREAQREADTAIDAFRTRRSVVGKVVVLPTEKLNGQPMKLASIDAKTLIVPLWSAEFAPSYSWMDELAMVADGRDDVELVPVHLQSTDSQVNDNKMDTAWSAQSLVDERTGRGSMAVTYGVTFFPFALIVDRDQRVIGLAHSTDQVKGLLPVN